MAVDKDTGVSDWHSIKKLEAEVGFPLQGNGSAHLQKDRGIGLTYEIEKSPTVGKIVQVRCVGFASRRHTHKAKNIPEEVRRFLKGSPCASCGTTNGIEIDHKDGNKQELANPTKEDFQALCEHCNKIKRERCKKCNETGRRFDATSLGYSVSYTYGNSRFDKKEPRCRGCYYSSPFDFRQQLLLKK